MSEWRSEKSGKREKREKLKSKNVVLNDTPKCRSGKREKWKARKVRKVKNKNRCAQRHSKVSECGSPRMRE
ncbi:MAG: hypothetical protein WC721_03585 [Victivallaceae bacterium]